MQWNGTFIGIVGQDLTVLETIRGQQGTYWRFHYENTEHFAQARECADRSPALLDQIKPFFGLCSVGTHTCQQGSKFWILYRVVTDDAVLEDVPISALSFELPIDYQEEVCNMFLFRILFGLSTIQRDVLLRTENEISSVISTRENSFLLSQWNIPSTVGYWFSQELSEHCCKWLGIYSTEEYHYWCEALSEHFSMLEQRIDRRDSFRWLLDGFRSRLHNFVVQNEE